MIHEVNQGLVIKVRGRKRSQKNEYTNPISIFNFKNNEKRDIIQLWS